MQTFTVLMIATNQYVGYALDSIKSIKSNLFLDSKGSILVFTDNCDAFLKLSDERVAVKTQLIPNLIWPEATLLRYKIFEENWDYVDGEFVIYMDADTQVIRPSLISEAEIEKLIGGIGVVHHPGYYKTNLWKRMVHSIFRPSWESRKKSTAFVPIKARKIYVCGGVWMGKKSDLHHMITELSWQVKTDLNMNIIARWHDESHLNAWITKNKVSVRSPEWAYSYEHLGNSIKRPIIEVIKKPSDFKRIV